MSRNMWMEVVEFKRVLDDDDFEPIGFSLTCILCDEDNICSEMEEKVIDIDIMFESKNQLIEVLKKVLKEVENGRKEG
jgi:hypothetical protein